MKVLLVNTSERIGGAAVACNRLMEALKKNDIKTKMLVRDKQTDQLTVVALRTPKWLQVWRFVWERFVIWAANGFGNRKNLFAVDIANTGADITKMPEFKEADIIHLHWINQGMLSLNSIRRILESDKPVVWTMHDMWECTAICHHAHTCQRFKEECGNCPLLRYPADNDLSHKVFVKKKRIFDKHHFDVIAVSKWLANQVSTSSLLKKKRITVVPNTLSLDEFHGVDKAEARMALNLPADKHIVLFGAARIDDPIKGIQYLLKALRLLVEEGRFNKDELHLVMFGEIKFPQELLPRIPISYKHLGTIKDTDILSRLYSAADVTVSASLYETFGQTLIEAQACGCVPVSFGNSGQADIIRHKHNGYIADYLSAESLANGIEWGINKSGTSISKEEMRNEVERKYASDVVAKQYIEVYKRCLKTK